MIRNLHATVSRTKKQILTHKSSAPLTSVAFLPGCQHVALGTMTGQVFIHDLRTIHKPLATINAHDKPVTSILLQPGTRHISEGSSSDVKATNSKPRKKSEIKLPAPSKSSSEMPSQEVPVESQTNSKPEALCMPAVDPSQDVLSAIFSPVRPSEQVATQANHEQVEEKVLNCDIVMDNVFSPVRSGGHVPIDDVSSPSSSKPISNTMFVEDIFSPVRTSQNVDAASNFPDMLSPHCEDEAVSSPEPMQIAKSLSKAASYAEANLPECNSSMQNSKEKENLDPNKVITTPRTCKHDSNSVENIFPKHILSPLHQVEKPKQNSNSSMNKALKKPEVEIPENRLGHSSSDSSASDFTNQAASLLSTRIDCEAATTPGTDDTTKLSEEPTIAQKIYEGIRSESGASDLQVKLIRSCMAEVLEEFQDDVNRRMMHLQCVVTKQFLQLKETMQHLQHQLVLNNDLALENELLREENKLMKANF